MDTEKINPQQKRKRLRLLSWNSLPTLAQLVLWPPLPFKLGYVRTNAYCDVQGRNCIMTLKTKTFYMYFYIISQVALLVEQKNYSDHIGWFYSGVTPHALQTQNTNYFIASLFLYKMWVHSNVPIRVWALVWVTTCTMEKIYREPWGYITYFGIWK